jgi:MFS family permease
MAFDSLNRKPSGVVNPLDHDLSALHNQHSELPFGEKTHAANRTQDVTKFELWAARIGFLTGGFTVASWAPLIPFVQSELALKPHILGILLLGLGVGSFVGMPLAGKLTQKIGARNAIAASGLASCLLLVLLAMIPGFYFECVALLAYGVTLGCLEVSVNIYGTYLENRHKGRLMSGLHAAYSIGEVASAAALTALFVLGISPLGAVGTLMLVLAIVLVAFLRKIENHKIESPKKEKTKTGRITLNGHIGILAVICGVIFLTEGAMLDWSAIYLRDNAGVPQEASAFGYTLFVIAMALSRLIGDNLTTRIGARNMLAGGIILILLTLLALVLIPTPLVAFVALFIMGLGMANLAPVLISAASRTSSMDSVKAITAVTTVGYGGLLAGPALIGAISSAISLQGAFLFICALLAGGLVMIKRHQSVFK